jgi:hypothetical protein
MYAQSKLIIKNITTNIIKISQLVNIA